MLDEEEVGDDVGAERLFDEREVEVPGLALWMEHSGGEEPQTKVGGLTCVQLLQFLSERVGSGGDTVFGKEVKGQGV